MLFGPSINSLDWVPLRRTLKTDSCLRYKRFRSAKSMVKEVTKSSSVLLNNTWRDGRLKKSGEVLVADKMADMGTRDR